MKVYSFYFDTKSILFLFNGYEKVFVNVQMTYLSIAIFNNT